jgi:cytochrome P450
MTYFPDETARDALKFFHLSERMLLNREALETQVIEEKRRKDIFHYILQGRDPETGRGFTREQLHSDANLLVAAGSDGVAIALSASMFYLLQNPQTLQKCIHEIRTSFSTVDEICYPKVNNIPYLNAVLEESLRMSPPIPSALPRTVLRGGIKIDGLHIPEGVDVGVPTYAIHHNKTYFPDPWEFRPERWLGNTEEVNLLRKAHNAFSAGPMNCIGKKVAYLAYKLALAQLLYTYDVRAFKGKIIGGGAANLGKGREIEGEYQMKDWFVGYPEGPIVQFKVRSD